MKLKWTPYDGNGRQIAHGNVATISGRQTLRRCDDSGRVSEQLESVLSSRGETAGGYRP